jgi:hypothetical protein
MKNTIKINLGTSKKSLEQIFDEMLENDYFFEDYRFEKDYFGNSVEIIVFKKFKDENILSERFLYF